MTESELMGIRIEPADAGVYAAAKRRWDTLAKPIDGLGTLEHLICRIAAIQKKEVPEIDKKAVIVMIADNGVVRENVTQTDDSATAEVAALLSKKKSSLSNLLRGYPADIIPVDIGIRGEPVPGVLNKRVTSGTGNIAKEDAMTPAQCLQAIETGISLMDSCKEKGYGIIATGEMGIGNTTTSTAVLCALIGTDPADLTGRGAGLSDEQLEHKIRVISSALTFHGYTEALTGTPEEAFGILCKLGGLDLAGLTGLFMGGAKNGIPVIVDGLISAAAALLAETIVPGCRDYMLASHAGREKGVMRVLKRLDLTPVIDADLALGEGTGAALLFPLLDMALSLYINGTRFDQTEIAQYERHET